MNKDSSADPQRPLELAPIRRRAQEKRPMRVPIGAEPLRDYAVQLERDRDDLLVIADAAVARADRYEHALAPLLAIEAAWWENALDEDRPEHRQKQNNPLPFEQVVLFQGRGGRELLRLSDVFAARKAVNPEDFDPAEAASALELREDEETSPELTGRWRHLKSDRLYDVIGGAALERDGEPLVIYRSVEDPSVVWARPAKEFYDGRFDRLPDRPVRSEPLLAAPYGQPPIDCAKCRALDPQGIFFCPEHSAAKSRSMFATATVRIESIPETSSPLYEPELDAPAPRPTDEVPVVPDVYRADHIRMADGSFVSYVAPGSDYVVDDRTPPGLVIKAVKADAPRGILIDRELFAAIWAAIDGRPEENVTKAQDDAFRLEALRKLCRIMPGPDKFPARGVVDLAAGATETSYRDLVDTLVVGVPHFRWAGQAAGDPSWRVTIDTNKLAEVLDDMTSAAAQATGLLEAIADQRNIQNRGMSDRQLDVVDDILGKLRTAFKRPQKPTKPPETKVEPPVDAAAESFAASEGLAPPRPVPADGQHAPDCATKCRQQDLHKHDCDCGAAVAP